MRTMLPNALPLFLAAALLFAHRAPAQSPSAPPPQLMLKSLERRLGANPFDATGLNNLAVIRLAENDPFGAAELLERAQRLAPENPAIADNHARLKAWLAARMPQAASREALRAPPAQLPEPPPLWPRP